MEWGCLVAIGKCKCVQAAIIVDGSSRKQLDKFKKDALKLGHKVIKRQMSSEQLHAIYAGCRHAT